MLVHPREGGRFFRPRTLARVGAWLLPWTSVLVVSATIAHGLEVGLARTMQQPVSIIEPTPVTSAARWLTLGAVQLDGSVTSLSCLTNAASAVAAVLYVPAEDMDRVISELCLRSWL